MSKIATAAQICTKFKITGTLNLLSPLLIGSGSDDGLTDILVQKNKQGIAFIPGTSIAGALRHTILSNAKYQAAGTLLFGRTEDEVRVDRRIKNKSEQADWEQYAGQSSIIVEDILLPNAELIRRDGVCIDHNTGMAQDGSKYDFEAVERGAAGELTIWVTVREWQNELLAKSGEADIEATINYTAELLNSSIALGAKTTKGLGRVAVAKATVYKYDFNELADVKAWLLDKLPQPSYKADSNFIENPADFVCELDCALLGSLIIRTNDTDQSKLCQNLQRKNEKLPDTVQLRSAGDFVIPGSSIKGVLRSHSAKIMRVLGKDTQMLIGLMGQEQKEQEDKRKSRLYVDEVYIKENDKTGALEQADTRNKIDRFTNATIDSALFTTVPIVQSSRSPIANIRLRIADCQPWEAGLALLLIKDLWSGDIALGGEKSVGRGRMQGINAVIKYANKTYLMQNSKSLPEIKGEVNELEKLVQALQNYDKAVK